MPEATAANGVGGSVGEGTLTGRDANQQDAIDTATHTDRAEQEEQPSQHAGKVACHDSVGGAKGNHKLYMTVQCQEQNRL